MASKRATPLVPQLGSDEWKIDHSGKEARVQASQGGKTWLRLMAKCVLQVTGKESKFACGMEQLMVGLEAVIKGGIHDMCLLWEHHSQEEE